MDEIIFGTLHSLAGKNIVLDYVLIFCAAYLQYVIGVVLLYYSLWPHRRLRLAITAVVSAAIARIFLKTIIVFFWARERPFVDLQDVQQLITHADETSSFPSGHALFFFALATVAYQYDRKLGRWLFGGATLMGLARIAVGVHWPSDIVAGAVLGMLTALGIVRFVLKVPPDERT